MSLLSAKEGKLQTHIFGAGIGLLFVLIGNYLPKLPRNFFFGVRTPWTLASEIVWRKTHILSGWIFVLTGIVIIILSFLKIHLSLILLIITLPLILSCFLYPLLLYKKLERGEKIKTPEL